ncbi:DNA-binding transcriptional regulator, MerR family [Desulfotomaculum arcticum]|uniref:DNA-binding transcriptional regulator, MerR family n=1 Tax=Desulfotruncus arcticus DSM 17038 TaxID=1121424 RepID=A0A1I2YJN8_9FIRM|nr:MerR family transcriptional regulator [Desulfotruncus arcticus]SFH25865.1 DNA-binding transcriptional regulator, MerR family [Desulfotomaculum arcticum] [Desulfotruncus arcticus DSM 17038]
MFYSIGEFSKVTGLSIHTLRYYEKEKLIYPVRDKKNKRQYTEKDRAWVAFILKLKETAMPIREIKKYAKLRYEGNSTLKERLRMLQSHRLFMLEEKKKLEKNIKHLDEKIKIYEKNILLYEK